MLWRKEVLLSHKPAFCQIPGTQKGNFERDNDGHVISSET